MSARYQGYSYRNDASHQSLAVWFWRLVVLVFLPAIIPVIIVLTQANKVVHWLDVGAVVASVISSSSAATATQKTSSPAPHDADAQLQRLQSEVQNLQRKAEQLAGELTVLKQRLAENDRRLDCLQTYPSRDFESCLVPKHSSPRRAT